MFSRARRARSLLASLIVALSAVTASAQDQQLPERVTFQSADGKTTLDGYVFAPKNPAAERVPGVVLMHGRAGPYSSLAKGVYEASTLSLRHLAWGRLWAKRGYVAVLVDSFGPRGYPAGFGRFSYEDRPDEVNEVYVRPFDAYGALAYLRTRPDVIADRIGLQGWSNGGSAALATMAVDAPGITDRTPANGFRAALAFYPACGLREHFKKTGYLSYAPVRMFMGNDDEEVSPRRCSALVKRSRGMGGDITIRLYRGATHDFDNPAPNRQRNEDNVAAKEDATDRALAFFKARLEKP